MQQIAGLRCATMLDLSRRVQVDRPLDPTRDATLSTQHRPATPIGRKVQIELV